MCETETTTHCKIFYTYGHLTDAFVPAFNYFSLPNFELKWNSTVVAAIKFGSIGLQSTGVMHSQTVSLLWKVLPVPFAYNILEIERERDS